MKKILLVLISCAMLFLSSCNAEETTSTVSQKYANADDYLDRTWGLCSWKDPHFENAICFEVREYEKSKMQVPMGCVQVSPNLIEAMEDMPDNLRLRVAVYFGSMLPDEYWNTVLEGKTVKEHYEIGNGQLPGDDYAINETWFDKIYPTIYVSDEQLVDGSACRSLFMFYACMTKKEILELTCKENEAFYITAVVYK